MATVMVTPARVAETASLVFARWRQCGPLFDTGFPASLPHHGITINSAVLAGLTDELNYYRFLVLSLTV